MVTCNLRNQIQGKQILAHDEVGSNKRNGKEKKKESKEQSVGEREANERQASGA